MEPDLVCPRCNGKGRVYWCTGVPRGIPSYDSEVCRLCRGERRWTGGDVLRKPDPDPLEQYLADGGKWD